LKKLCNRTEQSVKDVKEEKSKILDNGMEDMKDLNEE
jgi:hypothetical protein